MVLPLAFAAASFGLQAASSIGAASQASANAKAQQRAQDEAARTAISDRQRAIDYAEAQFANDLAYSRELLDFTKQEFGRQNERVTAARETIKQNTSATIAQILTRQVEEDMMTVLQAEETRRKGARERATIGAQDRGVEGVSVDAILQDVFRQEGEAVAIQEQNRLASGRVLTWQAIAANAQGSQQMMDLQVQTYAPQQRLRTMQPTTAVQPAAPVAQVASTFSLPLPLPCRGCDRRWPYRCRGVWQCR